MYWKRGKEARHGETTEGRESKHPTKGIIKGERYIIILVGIRERRGSQDAASLRVVYVMLPPIDGW